MSSLLVISNFPKSRNGSLKPPLKNSKKWLQFSYGHQCPDHFFGHIETAISKKLSDEIAFQDMFRCVANMIYLQDLAMTSISTLIGA